MFRKLNRAIKGFLREKRLKLGKFLWDRKEKKKVLFWKILQKKIKLIQFYF